MFNLGVGEIVVILVAALLLLGPKRLPELARGLGKFMREFRRQTDEVRTVVEREFYRMDQELEAPPETSRPALPAPVAPGMMPGTLPGTSPQGVSGAVSGGASGEAPGEAPGVTPGGEAPAARSQIGDADATPLLAPVPGTVARPRQVPTPASTQPEPAPSSPVGAPTPSSPQE